MKDDNLFDQRPTKVAEPTAGGEVHSGPVSMTRHDSGAAPAARHGGNGGESPIDVSLIPKDLTPEQLIYVAIHRNIDPDALEKLVTLQERMDKTRGMKAFNAALVRFKELCPAIRKNKTADIKTDGGGYSFTFAEIDQIAMTADPFLQQCGFSYMWNQTATQNSVTETCILMHEDGHQRESSFTVPAENKSGATPQQKFGGASTFAQRRAFAAVLGLVTTDKDFNRKDVDPTPITDDQIVAIDDMIREKGMDDDAKARFLVYMKVARVKDIRAVEYDKAMKALKRFNPRAGGAQ